MIWNFAFCIIALFHYWIWITYFICVDWKSRKNLSDAIDWWWMIQIIDGKKHSDQNHNTQCDTDNVHLFDIKLLAELTNSLFNIKWINLNWVTHINLMSFDGIVFFVSDHITWLQYLMWLCDANESNGELTYFAIFYFAKYKYFAKTNAKPKKERITITNSSHHITSHRTSLPSLYVKIVNFSACSSLASRSFDPVHRFIPLLEQSKRC